MQVINFNRTIVGFAAQHLAALGQSESDIAAWLDARQESLIAAGNQAWAAATDLKTHPEYRGNWRPFAARVWADTRASLRDWIAANP
jgi:hypothetical protein